MFSLINRLSETHQLQRSEWIELLSNWTVEDADYAARLARAQAQKIFGRRVYTRGLIEFTNICKNNCYYCGIRAGNSNISRYRLSVNHIMQCAAIGYQLGFRTFVLQGGEDPYYTPESFAEIINSLRRTYPDCAITLSFGEYDRAIYQMWFDAGADRYLLRHETADPKHYSLLHPAELSSEYRKQCLKWLKEIGYQTGTGFMVGSPGQTAESLADDFLFIRDLQPEMVGIGPFISHHDTPFADQPNGSVALTVFLLSLLRLMIPDVLLPATTALGTLDSNGREKGILAGANVVMPNLSPADVRSKYMLYDNKLSAGAESAQGLQELRERMNLIGYELTTKRGDSPRT